MNYYLGGFVFFRRPENEAKKNHVAACLVKHDGPRDKKRKSLTIE
jgi:hypothetical protein